MKLKEALEKKKFTVTSEIQTPFDEDPVSLMKALEANLKVSKFGIRELERILFDQFAPALVEMRDRKVKRVLFGVDGSGKLTCTAAPEAPGPRQGS